MGQQIVLPDVQKEESDAETVIIEAKKNVFSGKYDEAIKLLEKLLSNDRTNALVAMELAKVYNEKNDWEGVKRYAELAIKNDSQNIYYLEYFTNLIVDQPFDPEREKYFNQLISLTEAKERHYDNYLSYLISNNRLSSAKTAMDKMQIRFGETEKILQRSYEICNYTHCKEKESIIRKLIAKDNFNIGYKKLLAQFYISKNNQKAALDIYKEVLQINPMDTESNIAVLKTTNDKKSAESAYLRTIVPLIKNQNIPIDEKVKELLPYLTALVEKNDTSFRTELNDIGQMLSLTHPSEAKAQAFYGDILYASNQYKGAIQQYQKTLKLNDRNYDVWFNLMKSLNSVEEYNTLEKVANNALDLFPNRVENYVLLGRTLIIQNKLSEAKDIIHEGIIVAGGNQKYISELNEYKRVITNISTLTSLLEIYSKEPETDKLDPRILEMLGDAAFKEGKSEIGLTLYKNAIKMGYYGDIKEKLFMKGYSIDR